MKKVQLLLTVFAAGLIFSCSKTETVNPEVAVSSTLAAPADILFATTALSGANEVPAVTTSASGNVVGTYNKTTKILAYSVAYAGITPTAWHIHKGAAGTTGGVIFDMGTVFSTPFAYATPALSATQEADMLAGSFYVNMHSAKSPSGEIRGQLAVAASTATGGVTGVYNNSTKILTVTVSYAAMTPVAWHIHKGAAGVAGPVIFDLGSSFSSGYTYKTMALTTDQEADLKAGLFYVNIHSAKAPNGEIRGQLAVK